MKLEFERIQSHNKSKIKEISNIINSCGIDMYERHGLNHWSKEYTINMIEKEFDSREVFLARDLCSNKYIHTFQLEHFIENNMKGVVLHKFATSPLYSGLGIGDSSLKYIEEYCEIKNIKILKLEVYEKSINAIKFYEKRGFKQISTRNTTNFSVIIMQKLLFN
ncbi:GNAT family N-acetyltransferase [Pseudogracilibacillus sp. ICA-222130]|uniref:GNAT family N-acetyltransferase n=1 Tax=Pseudogracilibacillus sp. ICA-222130 TaxID=3134655 RepID=UPI0030BFFBDE